MHSFIQAVITLVAAQFNQLMHIPIQWSHDRDYTLFWSIVGAVKKALSPCLVSTEQRSFGVLTAVESLSLCPAPELQQWVAPY
jgi:hypothetical protein